MNRLKGFTVLGGASSSLTYVDTPISMSVTETAQQYSATQTRQTRTDYDGLGRAFRTVTGTGTLAIQTQTAYDGLHRQMGFYLRHRLKG